MKISKLPLTHSPKCAPKAIIGSIVLIGAILTYSQSQPNLMQASVSADGDLVVEFAPHVNPQSMVQLQTSTDMQNWQVSAFRLNSSSVWHGIDASLALDSLTGNVVVTIPGQDRNKLFARLNLDPVNPSVDDSDSDGIPNWLEDYAETIDEGLDTDGDGISDQVEILTGTDHEVTGFADEQEEVGSYVTGLRVFTPVVGE